MDADYRRRILRVNYSYWFCHRANRSRAQMVHGSVHAIPRAIGPVHTAVFGSILLHLRDPFLTLHDSLSLWGPVTIRSAIPAALST